MSGPDDQTLGEHDGARVLDYNSGYQGANYFYLRRIAHMVRPDVPNQINFYDVGCGKGRALCVMARQPFKKVVGIELREELCHVARDNAANLRGRRAPIEIVCADAVEADISDGHVYFLYNPFGRSTLSRVLDNIERSLVGSPRRVNIVYYNAVCEDLFSSRSWLERYHVLPTFSGVPISMWRNRGPAS
jgi:SAM-dependent methyltransferase